jgi:hypothetical protein
MSAVLVRVEAGREWVQWYTRVPLLAARPQDCTATFVSVDRPSSADVGAVMVECLRNDRGVQTSIVMPNGYCFPTGRIAPRQCWFQMLKVHLRSLLAATADGRVYQCARTGLETMARMREAGEVPAEKAALAEAKLREVMAGLDGRPPVASADDVAAGFFNWVTEAAAAGGLSQAEVVAAVGRAIRTGSPARVPDVDPTLYADLRRFIDL